MDNFSEIIERYSEAVFNHCLKMIKNTEEAEELTQDIFMKIYNGLPNFRGDSSIKTWIYRITVNTCLTKLNSKDYKFYRKNNVEISNDIIDSTHQPEKNFLVDESRQKLELSLNKLTNDDRQVLLLYYFDMLSYKEISEVLETSIGTVCTKIYRSRQKLKRILLREMQHEM